MVVALCFPRRDTTRRRLLRRAQAVYWTTVTVTTVGYGDYSPHTPGGKLLAMAFILVGIGAVFTIIHSFAGEVRDRRIECHRGAIHTECNDVIEPKTGLQCGAI